MNMINQIIQGDAYKLIKSIPDKSIDLIYTDIPYDYKHNTISERERERLSENTSSINKRRITKIIELENFAKGIDYSILNDFIRVLKKINIFIWCSYSQLFEIHDFFKRYSQEHNINISDYILVWCKTNTIPNNNIFKNDLEYCLYIRESNVYHSNKHNLKNRFYVSATNQKDKKLYKHPTIKPLDLVKAHIQHTTLENQVVLDTFAGSGTTLVASKELNRKYIGFEISKEYVDIAKIRLKETNTSSKQVITEQTKLF